MKNARELKARNKMKSIVTFADTLGYVDDLIVKFFKGNLI